MTIWIVWAGYPHREEPVAAFTDEDAALRYVEEQNAKPQPEPPYDGAVYRYRLDTEPVPLDP